MLTINIIGSFYFGTSPIAVKLDEPRGKLANPKMTMPAQMERREINIEPTLRDRLANDDARASRYSFS